MGFFGYSLRACYIEMCIRDRDKEIKKFFLLYEGPYEVIEVKMKNSYVLQNRETREIVGTHNATNLKLYWSA